MVLELLKNHQFMVNWKKCAFGKFKIDYLGHIVFGGVVEVDPRKVHAMNDWPIPRDL